MREVIRMNKLFARVMVVGILLFGATLAYSNDEYTLTRSTVIKGTQTDILLTTASIIAWRLEISSGNTGSAFVINGGSITANKTSTFTYDTSSTQNSPQRINQTFLGALLTTRGSSEVRFYWDYNNVKPPKGEEGKGLDRK